MWQADPPLSQIESVIRAARWFVRPSDDLRPRTLEAARCYCNDRRAEQKLGGFLVAALLLLSFTSPAVQYVSVLRIRAAAPSSTEIHDRAIEFASRREIGSHWGMAEAFTHLRRVQANRLGQTCRALK